MMSTPMMAERRNPTLGKSEPDKILTGTDIIPVMLFASMIVVVGVSAK